jgi:hypothetical protein
MRGVQLPGAFPVSTVAMLVSAAAMLELGVSAMTASGFDWLLVAVGVLLLLLSPLDVYWRIRAGLLSGVGSRARLRRVSVSLMALSVVIGAAVSSIVLLGYGAELIFSALALTAVLAVAQVLVLRVASLPQRMSAVTLPA